MPKDSSVCIQAHLGLHCLLKSISDRRQFDRIFFIEIGKDESPHTYREVEEVGYRDRRTTINLQEMQLQIGVAPCEHMRVAKVQIRRSPRSIIRAFTVR